MNNKLIILSLFVLVLLATSVSATPSIEFVGTSMTMGDASGVVSNPNHDSEGSRTVNLTGTVTLKLVNDQATAVTFSNFGIESVTAVSAFGSDIALNTVGIESASTSVSVAANSNTTAVLTIRAKGPKSLDAINSNLIASAFKVGSFKLNATESSGSTKVITATEVDLNMQRKNQLTIKSVKWRISGKTQTADEDNDEVENVKPGENVRVEFEVENEYSASSNVDMEDVEFKIKSLDNDLDIDEDEDLGDISSDDKENNAFEFDLDEDTNDGTFNVQITLSGKDELGAKHGEKAIIRFKVERESHEIAIKSLTLSPEKVGCESVNARLVVSYVNIGKSDEDEVAIEVDAPKFNFNQKLTDIQLDQDDGDSSVFNIPIGANLEVGTYPIEIRTYYDQSKLTDNTVVVLTSTCEKKGATPIVTGNKPSATLSLATSSLNVKYGGNANLGVNVVNSGSEKATFTVDVDADWATSVASKTVTLDPGASSSVVFNLAAKSGAIVGQNSAVVEVKAGDLVLNSQAVNVNVEASEATTGNASDFFSRNSTAIWVIVDIILVVIAIILIKILFFRKPQPRAF